MQNAGQLIEAMKHRLGKTPGSRHNLYDSLNDAGEKILSEHDWSWLRATATKTIPAGKSAIPLPEDFQAIDSVQAGGSNNQTVHLGTLQDILDLRRMATNIAWSWMVALDAYQPTPPSTATRHLLQVYPTPSQDALTLTVAYRRGWRTIARDDASAVPALPAEFGRAIRLAACYCAWQFENNTPSPDADEYDREIARLIERDEERQTNLGPMRGGIQMDLTSGAPAIDHTNLTFTP